MVGLNVCIDTTTIKELYYVGFLFVDLLFDFFIQHSFYCNSSKIFSLGNLLCNGFVLDALPVVPSQRIHFVLVCPVKWITLSTI